MALWLPACLLSSPLGLEKAFAQYKFRTTRPKGKSQEQMLGEVNNKSDAQDSSADWNPSLTNLAAKGFPEVTIMPGSPLTALGAYPLCVCLIKHIK